MGLREVPSRSWCAAAEGGTAFISVKEGDRPAALEVVRQLQRLGFNIQATSGTTAYLRSHGVHAEAVNKVSGRSAPCRGPYQERTGGLSREHREHGGVTCRFIVDPPGALNKGLAYYTTIRGHERRSRGIEAILKKELTIRSLQEYHGIGSAER